METKERVINLISDKLGFGKTEIRLDQNLVSDLNADSLDVVEIVMGIEHEFGLKIDDAEISDIKTVGDIVEKVEKKRMGR